MGGRSVWTRVSVLVGVEAVTAGVARVVRGRSHLGVAVCLAALVTAAVLLSGCGRQPAPVEPTAYLRLNGSQAMAGNLNMGGNSIVNARAINARPIPSGDFVGTTDPQTLADKTLNSPVIQGAVEAGTGLTMPAFWQAGDIEYATDNAHDIGSPGGQRPRKIFAGTAFLAPNGSPTTPPFAFADQPMVGLFAAPDRLYAAADSLTVRKLVFGSSDFQVTRAALDADDMVGSIAVRNGDVAQSFSIYGRYLDPSTYHSLRLFWNDQLEPHLLVETSGPGMPEGKGLDIGSRQGEVNFWTGGPGGPDYQISTTAFRPLYATANPDLGTSTARWGSLYLAHTADVGTLKLNGSGSGMDANDQPLTNAGRWMEALLAQDEWTDLGTLGYDTSATGSGEVSQKLRRLRIATGGTALSAAVAAVTNEAGWSRGIDRKSIDWAKRVVMQLQVTLHAGTPDGVNRMVLGKDENLTFGPLVRRGVGFQIDNLSLYGVAHNADVASKVDLSTALVPDTTVRLAVVSDGTGNCTWYVDGVAKGTSDACPNRQSLSDFAAFQIEGSNGGDASDQQLFVHSVKIYVGQ